MPVSITGLAGGLHARALVELKRELARFRTRGLRALRRDLEAGVIGRGGWTAGCPLSYRDGARGTSRRDRRGRPGNLFTRLWDAGWLTDADVHAVVKGELLRRARRLTGASHGN